MTADSDHEAFEGPGPDAQYREHLAAGRFVLQVCAACAAWIFHPRLLCPACGSTRSEWREASGRGVVYSTSVIRRRPERGGDYNVAIVELAEGPRMMSRVEGMAPTDVAIGMAVTARIATEDDAPLVVFDAAPDTQ